MTVDLKQMSLEISERFVENKKSLESQLQGVFTSMDENMEKAWESYLTLCKLSASDFFTNMIPQVGLVSPFEDGCIKEMVDKLEKMLA